MYVIIGILIVFVSVLGGFVMEGGPIPVLMQVAEFLIIGGAAVGSILVSTPQRVLKQLLKMITATVKGEKASKQAYLELLTMLYKFFQVARKDGLIGLESHVEHPEKSNIFSKYPSFMQNHRAVDFLCDTVKIIVTGGIPPHDLELLMEGDIETHHEESAKPVGILSKVGDSLPGLGIVAAVLGIIVTMQAIDGPPEEIGHKVAAALVGTFLGVLLSYGLVQPLATNIDHLSQSDIRYFQCIKAALVAFSKNMPALVAAEFARRTIYDDFRPSFKEMEDACRSGKKP
jgi:chemotaxis protein MotA